MMYTDLPIQNVEEDELNRVEFAKNLGNLITNYKKDECLVLSLMGGWGSGKTSLINLTLNGLSKNTIIKFDPWLFPEHEKLILHFFNTLSSSIIFQDNSIQKSFRKNLKRLLNSLTLSASLSILVPLGLTLSVTKHSNNASSYESLEQLKEEINKDLDSLDSKIIIVIDDIDRLNKSEVKEIFQLVKSLADFKNIIYILSFDKEVVLKSLNGHVFSPEVFLEKIIQIPINIPKTEDYRLQKYFEKELIKLFKEKDIDLNDENFLTLINHLSFFIQNIRDIKRYLNHLNFYLDFLKSEVNIKDYALISALQMFENNIYNEIKLKKHLFVDLYDDYGIENAEDYRTDIKKIIKRNKKLDKNIILSILLLLFPKLNCLYSNIIYTSEELNEWYNERKIASSDFFDRYFTLTPPETGIGELEFENIINSKDLESLEYEILKLDKQGKSRELLTKIDKQHFKIPKNQIPLIIEVLLKNGDNLIIPSEDYLIQKETLISEPIRKLIMLFKDQNKRFDILKKCISEDSSLFILLILVDKEKRCNERPKFINEEQIKQLEDIVLDKIHNLIQNGKLLSSYHLDYILHRWCSLENKEVVKKFIRESLKDENKIITLISSFSGDFLVINQNQDHTTKKFNFDFIKNLIDLDCLKEELSKISESIKNEELIVEFKRELYEYTSGHYSYVFNS